MIQSIKNTIKSKFPFTPGTNGIDEEVAAKLKNASRNDSKFSFGQFESCAEGLSVEQAEEKLKEFGLNEVHHEKAPSWFKQLLHSFIFPFNAVLVVIAIISYITDVLIANPEDRDYKTIILLSIMILLSSLIRFWQEFRSNKAAETLKGMIKTTATVLRKETGKQEIEIKELVPGDIIFLSAGDMIPADCRIIQSKDLFITQSMLTGESLPVEKRSLVVAEADNKPPLELDNICFMGTNVASGTAMAIVIITGDKTYFGSLSKAIVGKRVETSFDKGVKSVSFLLIRFMMVMVPLVFLINGFTKGNWLEALLFAITVAVGLTPEMLPMIVTTNLAKGAVNMSRKKVIVKRLNAIQNFGAMDVLCTDKTGTLTQDRIILKQHLDIKGRDSERVLQYAFLNSHFQSGLKNLLDKAVLAHVELKETLRIGGGYSKLDEIPFDFSRRRLSVVVAREDGKHILICKGAVEEIFAVCSKYAFGAETGL